VTSKPMRVLGVIPARGGSKGIPGKNIRLLGGRPLIEYSIEVAREAKGLARTIVSTDDAEIARVARAAGADVPFMRPSHLATDATPMWPVLRHALTVMEMMDGSTYDVVLLLDPTSPFRSAVAIDQALESLDSDSSCDGVVGVTEPHANPFWHCVVEHAGYLEDLVSGASEFTRRQDVPASYTINGSLYAWRRRAILSDQNWRLGKLRKQLVPDVPFVPLDSPEQFAALDALVRAGAVTLPGSLVRDL
jgi:CMP-N-acetylneuraminic acid synthetase